MQWLAVITYFSWMRAPPQKNFLLWISATCEDEKKVQDKILVPDLDFKVLFNNVIISLHCERLFLYYLFRIIRISYCFC